MNFRNARARQPEIVRSVQKDARYTNELAEDLSDILRITGPRNWIKYNQLCQLIAQLSYHGFASINNLQTLGEEYTGIIQVDGNYKHIPSRLVRMSFNNKENLLITICFAATIGVNYFGIRWRCAVSSFTAET